MLRALLMLVLKVDMSKGMTFGDNVHLDVCYVKINCTSCMIKGSFSCQQQIFNMKERT